MSKSVRLLSALTAFPFGVHALAQTPVPSATLPDEPIQLMTLVPVGTRFDQRTVADSSVPTDDGDGPNVTRELLKRGYSSEEINTLWGGNFLRVFHEVETITRFLQTEKPAS